MKDGIDGDGVPIAQEPVFLGVEEVQGVVDEFGWLAVGPTRELALDALFGWGVEGEVHEGSISLEGCPVGVIGARQRWSTRLKRSRGKRSLPGQSHPSRSARRMGHRSLL